LTINSSHFLRDIVKILTFRERAKKSVVQLHQVLPGFLNGKKIPVVNFRPGSFISYGSIR
jgi:hypothetical protein